MAEKNNAAEMTMEELAKFSIRASDDFVDNLRHKREEESRSGDGESEGAEARTEEIDLFEAFGLDYGDVVSIIGAGGKTSLMYYLAKLAREHEMRVLLTTSTHIAVPDCDDIKVFTDFADLKMELRTNPCSAVYAYAAFTEGEKKFSAIDQNELELLKQDFDIFFIEADGAKRKSLKGWRDYEPVIYPCSNKCIMVLPGDYYDEAISVDKIFQPQLFEEQFAAREIIDENCERKFQIDAEVYLNILDSTQGPFAGAEDRPLYLYLSRSDLSGADIIRKAVDELCAGIRRRGYREIKIVHSGGKKLIN